MLEFYNHTTGKTEIVNADEVYGILCAPTCTMFSLARTTAKTPRDLASGMRLVKKCLEIIWFCRESNESQLKFWALENPMGLLRQFLGRPLFTFSPEEYGECDGYCDKSTHKIVINTENGDLEDFPRYQKQCLRHEIIHAFMFESGLGANWEHKPIGQEETTVDWIAVQFPKLLEVFEKAGAL